MKLLKVFCHQKVLCTGGFEHINRLIIHKMIVKILLIFTGVFVILLGLFLSFSIIMYSGKERDSSGYYFLVFSLSILVSGFLILQNGIKRNYKSN